MNTGATLARNIENAEAAVRRAKEDLAAIVCLPEYFLFPPLDPATVDPQELQEIGERTVAFLRAASKQHALLLVGNALRRIDGAWYNSAYIYDRGEQIGIQDKIHPTATERGFGIRRGRAYKVFETRFGPIGVLLCADILYPEAARVLALLGALIVFTPVASFYRHPDPTKDARRAMFVARALDNSFFLLKCGGVGHTINGAEVVGRSMITAPWGILDEADDERAEAIVASTLDIARLCGHRTDNYSLVDRNPPAYYPLVDIGDQNMENTTATE